MPYYGPSQKPIPADSVDVNAIKQEAVAQALSQARALIDQAKSDVLTEADQKAADAQQAAVSAAAEATRAAMHTATQNAQQMSDAAAATALEQAAVQNKTYTDAQLASMDQAVGSSVSDLQKKISDQQTAMAAMSDILPAARAYADAQDRAVRAAVDSSVAVMGSGLTDAISHAQQGAVDSAASTTTAQVQASAVALQKQITDAVNSLKASSVDPLTTQITTLQGQAYKIETRDGIQVPAVSLLNLSGSVDVPVTWTTPFQDANYTITKPQVSLQTVNLVGKVNAEVKSKDKNGCVITVTTVAVLSLGNASLSVLAYRKVVG